MARKRKQNGGLDITGVGRANMNLPGGDMKSRSGLELPKSAKAGKGKRGAAPRRKGGHRGDRYVGNASGRGESRRTLLIVLAIAVGAVLLAVGVGVLVYQQVVRNAVKPEVDTQALSSVLTAPSSADDSTWNLLVRTDATSAETGRGNVRDIALVYLDTDNKTATFLWLDVNTRVYLDGYGYQTMADAFSLQGEAGLVASAAKLGSLSIAHYLEFNENGLNRFAEDLGSLDVDLGTADKNELASAFCKKIFGSGSSQTAGIAQDLTACAGTDLDADGASALLTGVQGMDVNSGIRQASEPVKTATEDGATYTAVDADAWGSMTARVETGLSPEASKRELGEYESMRSGSVVDIWNGVGVSGIANDCSQELKKLGWKIGKTGNAAQFVYSETLVVYNSTSKRELAELVVSDLGQGRVVMGAGRYSFTGDVLVVLGSDYRPY